MHGKRHPNTYLLQQALVTMANKIDIVSALMEFICSLREKDKVQVHGEISTITAYYAKCQKGNKSVFTSQNIRERPDRKGSQGNPLYQVMCELRPEEEKVLALPITGTCIHGTGDSLCSGPFTWK